MTSTPADVLLHPIRMRIVLAFGTEKLTTAEVAERLPDVAHATLYRQVAILAEAGMLEVVDERRVRGGVERTYAVASAATQLGREGTAALSKEELLRGFTVFAGSLIEAFGRYLDDPTAEPTRDPVGYRQAGLWLDAGEREELIGRLRTAVEPYLQNEPAKDRARLLLNTILIPDAATTPRSRRSGSTSGSS